MLKDEKWDDFVFYCLLIIGCIVILWIDKKDTKCPTLDSTEEECNKSGGMAFSNTYPNETDSTDTLLDKIAVASKVEQETIKWRSSFLLSVLISSIIFLLVQEGKLPHWNLFLLLSIVIFGILNSYFSYYSYHVYRPPADSISNSVKILRSRFKSF